MRRTFRILLVVLLLFGAVVAFGAWLPVGHVASSRMELAQPAGTVFATLIDFAGQQAWRAGTTIERLPDMDGQELWRETNEFGAFDFVVEEVDPPHRFVTRIVNEDLPFAGRWIYEVEPRPDGCAVTITEDGEIRSVLFRALARLAFGYHRAQFQFLSALASQFGEVGEPRKIEPTLAAPSGGG